MSIEQDNKPQGANKWTGTAAGQSPAAPVPPPVAPTAPETGQKPEDDPSKSK